MNTLLSLLAVVAPAYAEDPEFLLSDLSVRLDLDKSRWRMTKWSTFDFNGEGENGALRLRAWASPVQTPVKPAEDWGTLYVNLVTDQLNGTNPKVVHTEVADLKGARWAFVDVDFELPNVGRAALRGATTEIEAQNFHFYVLSAEKNGNVAERERDKIAKKLEFTKPVPELPFGGKVQTEHMSTTLPPGWRSLHEGELDAVGQRILKFGVEDVTGCWVALRPRPSAEPDLMLTCPRPYHVGVVDEASFAGTDAQVRKAIFGEIPAGKTLGLGDRTGFLYAPRDGLAFAVIPDSERVSVTWAMGEGALDEQLLAALAPASFVTPHEVTSADWQTYYLNYQSTSALVVCPALCVVVGLLTVVGIGVAVVARRRSPEEDDE